MRLSNRPIKYGVVCFFSMLLQYATRSVAWRTSCPIGDMAMYNVIEWERASAPNIEL